MLIAFLLITTIVLVIACISIQCKYSNLKDDSFYTYKRKQDLEEEIYKIRTLAQNREKVIENLNREIKELKNEQIKLTAQNINAQHINSAQAEEIRQLKQANKPTNIIKLQKASK